MTDKEILELALDTTRGEAIESVKAQGLSFWAALEGGFFGDYLNREIEALLEHELQEVKHFKDLGIGGCFIFASETDPLWPGARGPWVKISPRLYRPTDREEFHHQVGTIHVDVIEKPEEVKQ